MKKITKFLLSVALVILLFIPVSQVKADSQQDNVGGWYPVNNQVYSEYKINGKWYTFDARGNMITGWHLYEFHNGKGGIIKNWYYYDPVNGDKKLGWQNINGKWYYLTRDGALMGRQQIDGKWYYFDPVNCGMRTGWVAIQDSNLTDWYYYDPVNGDQKLGWQNIDGKWYYFAYNALRGPRTIDGKSYYFDLENCDMRTGWVAVQRYDSNVTDWYYYDPENGVKKLGWQNIDGKWYYLGGSGAYSGQIYTIDRKRYYFDSDSCELKTGWFEFEGSKYYADPNDGGAVASNKTLVIDGISYTFNYDGSVINNEP